MHAVKCCCCIAHDAAQCACSQVLLLPRLSLHCACIPGYLLSMRTSFVAYYNLSRQVLPLILLGLCRCCCLWPGRMRSTITRGLMCSHCLAMCRCAQGLCCPHSTSVCDYAALHTGCRCYQSGAHGCSLVKCYYLQHLAW